MNGRKSPEFLYPVGHSSRYVRACHVSFVGRSSLSLQYMVGAPYHSRFNRNRRVYLASLAQYAWRMVGGKKQ